MKIYIRSYTALFPSNLDDFVFSPFENDTQGIIDLMELLFSLPDETTIYTNSGWGYTGFEKLSNGYWRRLYAGLDARDATDLGELVPEDQLTYILVDMIAQGKRFNIA